MLRHDVERRLYLCVDGDMPLLQEGISSIVCKELPDIRLLEPGERYESEPVLLLLCVADPKKAESLLKQYRANYPILKTVLLYDNTQDTDMQLCLSMGCCCVIKSSLSKKELIECIHMTGNNLFLWDKDLATQLLTEAEKHHNFIRLLKEEVVTNTPTKREIEIAKCILSGMDNEDIGRQLYLSPGTIKNNIAMIMEKYEFHSRAQIISLLAL